MSPNHPGSVAAAPPQGSSRCEPAGQQRPPHASTGGGRPHRQAHCHDPGKLVAHQHAQALCLWAPGEVFERPVPRGHQGCEHGVAGCVVCDGPEGSVGDGQVTPRCMHARHVQHPRRIAVGRAAWRTRMQALSGIRGGDWVHLAVGCQLGSPPLLPDDDCLTAGVTSRARQTTPGRSSEDASGAHQHGGGRTGCWKSEERTFCGCGKHHSCCQREQGPMPEQHGPC